MKKSFLVLAIVVGMAVMAGAARADVVFTLDTVVDPGTVLTPTAPYGTISLANNAGSIDVTVNLNGGNGVPYVISLNYLGGPGTTGWSVGGGNIGAAAISTGQNNQGFNGWFDIWVQDQSALTNPLMFTLSNSILAPLDVSSFITKDEFNNYYAVVRTAGTDLNSWFYGATTVPEPSTLILLGSGLLGLVGYGRKRMKK